MNLFHAFLNRRLTAALLLISTAVSCLFAQTGELLLNGDFSTDSVGKPASWATTYDTLTASTVRDTTMFNSAPASCKITGLRQTVRTMLFQSFTSQYSVSSVPAAVPGETLLVSFYARGQRSNRSLQFTMEAGLYDGAYTQNAYQVYSGMAITTVWTKFTYSFRDTGYISDIKIHFEAKDSAVIWIDDVSIKRKADASSVRPYTFSQNSTRYSMGSGSVVNLGKQTTYRMVLLNAQGSEWSAETGTASVIKLAPRGAAAGWYVAKIVTADDAIVRRVLVK